MVIVVVVGSRGRRCLGELRVEVRGVEVDLGSCRRVCSRVIYLVVFRGSPMTGVEDE